MNENSMAIIYLDGEEFINCHEGDDYKSLYEETKVHVPEWKEASLMVFKPKYGIFIREKLDMR